MVLYCSAHETTVLRMLVHKMKNHPDEEMIYFTTVGTYPFYESNKDFSSLYRKVVEFNTAIGKNVCDKDEIRSLIINEMSRLLNENKIDLKDCTEIYVVEDIYHPYSIYFESLNIPYTAIEISPNAFYNKSKFTLEKNLYKRTEEYFELAQELGAFTGTGMNCKRRIFNIESLNNIDGTIEESVYDYVEEISSLSQIELNKCINLYGIPNNLEINNKFTMLLTNSRGFIEGRHSEITYKEIPRIYQKFIDYYLEKEEFVYIKPHPNSQGVNYRELFEEEKIIEEKFLVDLIPFIEHVKLGGVINIASTASVLLEKYCDTNYNLGESYFLFSLYIQKVYAMLRFIEGNNISINKIYTIGIDVKQIQNYLLFNNIKNIEVGSLESKSVVDENTLILVKDLKQLSEELFERVTNIKNHHAVVGVLTEDTAYSYLRDKGIDVTAYLIEISEFIRKTNSIEINSCSVLSENPDLKNVESIKELSHSKNIVEIRSSNVLYNKKVCIFGGNVVRWIVESLKKKFDVTYLPWISPLSVASKGVTNVNDSDISSNITNEIEIKKELSKWMSNTDYLVLDLETLRYDLLEYSDTYFTDTRTFRNLEFYKQNENKINILNVLETDDKFIEERLNSFVDLILSTYKPENIIVIKSGKAINSYISNHIIKNWKTEKYNEFIRKWETYIVNKTNCKSIDIWKRYMSKYRDNAAFFEKFYYEDVVWNVISMFANKHINFIDEADFSYRLRGYLKFYDFAVYRKYANFFLDSTDKYESFILKTSNEFIEKNFVGLVNIKKNSLVYSKDKAEKCIHESNAEIKRAYEEIQAIESSYYLENDSALSVVFTYRFEILKILEVKLKEYILENFNMTIDINSQNIYEVFILTQQFHNKMLSKKNCVSLLHCINSLTKRELIDVWGSCVSREIFNMNFSYFKVNTYLMRNSIIHTGCPPVKVQEGILVPDNFTNEWVFRNCHSEWNRTCRDRLNSSEAKWIVVDLHDVFFPNYYYRNEKNVFCKAFNLDFMPFYKFIENDIYTLDYSDEKYDDDFFKKAIQCSVEILREKYGNNIIVIDTIWKKYYLDEQRNVRKFSIEDRENKSIDRKNHIAQMLSNYLVDNLNCYHITFLSEFLADELWHGGEISQSHYERYFYEEAYNVIEDIVKRKPEKKVYSHSRISTRIRRIKELSLQKNNHEYLQSVYDTYLDKMLIEMDNVLIDKYENVIEYIYQKRYENAMQMLECFDFESNNACELKDKMYKIYQYM